MLYVDVGIRACWPLKFSYHFVSSLKPTLRHLLYNLQKMSTSMVLSNFLVRQLFLPAFDIGSFSISIVCRFVCHVDADRLDQ